MPTMKVPIDWRKRKVKNPSAEPPKVSPPPKPHSNVNPIRPASSEAGFSPRNPDACRRT